MKLHEQLSAARQRRFTNVSRAARALDISREALRRIELGELLPKDELLRKMIEVFQIPGPLARELLDAREALRSRAPSAAPQATVDERGMSRFVGQVSADIVDLLRNSKSLRPDELHAGVEKIVRERLHQWRNKERVDGEVPDQE